MTYRPLTTSLIACLAAMPLALTGCSESHPGQATGPELSSVDIIQASAPQFDPDASIDPAVGGSNALAIDLYRELSEQGQAGDNLFFSPISVSAALMMTYEGARGDTQAEFEHVLALDDTERIDAHRAYAGMLGRLSGEGRPYELSIANALWGERSMPFTDAFLDTVSAHYEAGFASVDFVGDYENQRLLINEWVEDRTNERIVDLLPADSLSTDTRLVLVNAIYFLGEWSKTFEQDLTRDEDFHLIDSEGNAASVEVPMMRQSGERFRYADFDGYDALAMHYEGRDLSMLVLLPDENDGLPDLESQLDSALIGRTVEALAYEPVNLRLPKWEMRLAYDLIPALQELGMESAFAGDTADFTGLSDSAEAEDLFISGVFHQAFIAVDESGTEAAAATAVVVAVESAVLPPDDPIEFVCDHPFVYLIMDNETGTILFMGRVTDPS